MTTRLPSLFEHEPFMLDDAFRSFMRPFRWEPAPEAPQIRLEVTEKDGAYLVKAQIPGVSKEDIHVEIEGRQVMISTEFKKESEKKDERMLRSELSYGFASRVFTLGAEVDRDKAEARYADGVLTLTLPKLAQPRGSTLTVK